MSQHRSPFDDEPRADWKRTALRHAGERLPGSCLITLVMVIVVIPLLVLIAAAILTRVAF